MPARGADPPGEQHFPASDQESGLLVEDGGPSADTNTAASSLVASTISMVEPTQLVQTNASSSGNQRNARENLKELKSLSQGLDQKDKQAKIRAKEATTGNTSQSSPAPGASSKKGRGEFPNEKFGATTRPAPNSNNSRQTSTASSNNSNSSRGLSNNAFPNEKFGRPRSTNPAAEPAAASSSQVIVNHGQQVAPAYQPGQIQLGHSNPPMQDVEPTIHVEPTDPPPIVEETGDAQDDYLVEATLVSPKEEEDRQDVGEVLEAQEVTLRDVLQIKGVRCLVGSVVGCFLLVLGILVVALVLLTSGGGGGGSSDSATTTAETAAAPLPPTMSPTIEFAATLATSVAATMAPTFIDGDDSSTSDLVLTEPPLVALPEQPAPAEPVTTPQVTSPPVSAPATVSPEEERGTLGPTTQVFTQEYGDTFAPAPAAIPESDEGGTSAMQPDDSQADDKEGTDPAIIAIIVTAVIVAVAMIAFVPAFLMYMKRKLQMEHHKKRHSMACQKGAASEL